MIPLIGCLMLGNPDNYRMLGVYTHAFRNGRRTAELFVERGLEVDHRRFFFSCATRMVGRKPRAEH